LTWYELSKDLWEIIDQIADDLIGDAAWQEGDPTWDTTTKTGENARRVCHHIADDIYLALIQSNTATSRRSGASALYAKGLIVVISDAWDGGAHEPSGNIQIVFVPFEADNGAVVADLADFEIDHKLFTGSSGFALVGVPPPNASDIYQCSFLVVVERNTNKIYADGFTNFHIYVDGNNFNSLWNTQNSGTALFGVNVRWYRYTHAFTLQAQDAYQKAYLAFKSTGDNKAYFMKPVLHNDTGERSPWLQPEFWIAVSSSKTNLADDDVLAMPVPSTKTYQVTLKQSPDYTNYLRYAIIKTE